MEPEEHERPERRGWHFEKKLSLGDLYAVAGAAALVITSYHLLEKRATLTEKDVAAMQAQVHQLAAAQKAVDARQDDEALRYQARFEEAMREINRKLDRLIERGAPRVP
jgi:hypothetical protein